MKWIRESPARWDADKARIVGGEEVGVFDTRYAAAKEGQIVPGEWWRVEDDGEVVGYGWLDVCWGDAEILLATVKDDRGRGVGSFILDRLGDEARERGLRYLSNLIRPTHPHGDELAGWLTNRGFEPCADGRLMRAVVR